MDDLARIQQQIEQLQLKAQELQQQRKASAIDEVRSLIKAYGLTARDCGFSGGKRSSDDRRSQPVAIKYRRGENTWTGRGRQPKWVAEFVSKGGRLSDLQV